MNDKRGSSVTADSGTPSGKVAGSTGKERLLAAALKQVRSGSLASVTARTICSEARVTAPTLYHFFGDLSGLYSAVLEHIFEVGITGHPSEYDDPHAVLDFMWDKLLELAEREAGVIDLFNQLLSAGMIPDLMRTTYSRLESAFEVINQTMPLKIEAKLAAEVYWAAALGMSTIVAATQHGVPYPTGAAQVLQRAVLNEIFGNNRRERPAKVARP